MKINGKSVFEQQAWVFIEAMPMPLQTPSSFWVNGIKTKLKIQSLIPSVFDHRNCKLANQS